MIGVERNLAGTPKRSWRFVQGSRRGPCGLAIRPRTHWRILPGPRGTDPVDPVPWVPTADGLQWLAQPVLLPGAAPDPGPALSEVRSLRSAPARRRVRLPGPDSRPVGSGAGRRPWPCSWGPRCWAASSMACAAPPAAPMGRPPGPPVAPRLRAARAGAPGAAARGRRALADAGARRRRARVGLAGADAGLALGPPPDPPRRPDRAVPPRSGPGPSPWPSRRLWYGAFNATFVYRGSVVRGSSRRRTWSRTWTRISWRASRSSATA